MRQNQYFPYIRQSIHPLVRISYDVMGREVLIMVIMVIRKFVNNTVIPVYEIRASVSLSSSLLSSLLLFVRIDVVAVVLIIVVRSIPHKINMIKRK